MEYVPVETVEVVMLNRRGFTLVEILVVMAIIGILASLGTSSFLTSRLRGRDAERKASIGQIQRALELYYNDYNRYPAADGGEIAGCGAAANEACPWGGAFEDANNVYMSTLPSDSRAPNQQYLYEASADGQRYRLYARLENTEDMATDLDNNGVSNDEFNGSFGDGQVKSCGAVLCNYGISSSSTNMTEAL